MNFEWNTKVIFIEYFSFLMKEILLSFSIVFKRKQKKHPEKKLIKHYD